MNDELKNYIKRFVRLSEPEMATVISFFEFRRASWRTLLLKAGEICSFEAFILSGCVCEYYLDGNRKEHTIEFAVEDWWVSDITSFENRVPGQVFSDTLEDTTFLMLTPDSEEALLKEVPKLDMFRIMMQRHLNVIKNRLLRNMSNSAMDLYQMFLNRYPDVIRRVPQYYIASYLGISQEFLSKLRKRAKG